jgi:hypothetical protein
MSGHTHSLAEWAASLSLGVGVWASLAAAIWLAPKAEDVRLAVRDAAVWLAALLILTIPTGDRS